jgi:hypothetical protein
MTSVNCASGDLSSLVERVEDALVQADEVVRSQKS